MDSPSFFGIEDTMELGVGNTELLKDLLSPESVSSNPDSLIPVGTEIEQDTPPPDKKIRGKEIIPEGEDGKAPTGQEIISSFLGSEENEEGEEDSPAAPSPTPKPGEEEPANEGSQFGALAKDLLKLGVFTQEEGEEDVVINTPQEFLERFEAEKKKGAIEVVNNFIGQFGEDYQNAFEAIFVKGVNPKEYFSLYNTVVEFAQLDMTDERNQETVVRQALTDQGFEPDDVVTEIERLKNYGDLESVAAKHHKVLVKKEALKLQEKERKAEFELQQKAAIKQQYVKNVQTVLQDKLKTKEFDGIPINPKLANELQDFLLVDKWETPTGEKLTDFDRAILELKNPQNHAMKVKIGLLLKIMEKDPTLSTIQKSGVTKQTNQLFTETARQVTKSKTSGESPKSWFS